MSLRLNPDIARNEGGNNDHRCSPQYFDYLFIESRIKLKIKNYIDFQHMCTHMYYLSDLVTDIFEIIDQNKIVP